MLQVVSTVDAVHSDMGCLLLILHTAGVWILQRPPGESLPSRHSRPNCLPYRRSCALLCGLPRCSLLPHCLQSQPNCYSVLEISFSGGCAGLLSMGCYLQGTYVRNKLAS